MEVHDAADKALQISRMSSGFLDDCKLELDAKDPSLGSGLDLR